MDNPARHALYMEHRALMWLRSFPSVPGVAEPIGVRMLEADLYDGLGSLLPLGAYWWEKLQKQSYNFWPVIDVFGMFTTEQLKNPTKAVKTYIALFQLNKYEDNVAAFNTYLKQRGVGPDFEIGNYSISGDGEIIDCGTFQRIDVIDERWVASMQPVMGEDDDFDIL